MDNHWVGQGTAFGLVDLQDGLFIEGTGPETIDGLGGEGYELAFLNGFSAGEEVGGVAGLNSGPETGLVEGGH
jgi:hypothetical protein